MPERFVRIMRGLDVAAEVPLNNEETISIERDLGRNIDPKTGEMPTDDEGNELPILPEVIIVRVSVPKSAGAGAEQAGEPTREDLYARAQELDIPGRSEMNKEELAEAIEDAENA